MILINGSNNGSYIEELLENAVKDLFLEYRKNNKYWYSMNEGAYAMMEEYGRFKFMLKHKELFEEKNIERVLFIYGGGSMFETLHAIQDYYTSDKNKRNSESKGVAPHFLMQSIVEIVANSWLDMFDFVDVCDILGISEED